MTSESTVINPNSYGTGDFNVIAVYFTNTPGVDQPHGTITVETAQVQRTANYLSGGTTFAPDSTVKAQTATRDGAPSSRVDSLGNFYVCRLPGVPAGGEILCFVLRPTSRGGP